MSEYGLPPNFVVRSPKEINCKYSGTAQLSSFLVSFKKSKTQLVATHIVSEICLIKPVFREYPDSNVEKKSV